MSTGPRTHQAAGGGMTSISEMLPVPEGWPEPPAPDAYYGLAGDIVGAIAPHTEADPVAVLVQLLVAYGALIGGGAWFEGGEDPPLSQRVRCSHRRFRCFS